MPADQPELSIVVMFTHDAEQAKRCLAAIAVVRAELPESETVIVLNRSTAEVRAAAAEHASDARVIDSPVNTGTAVAWQLAFTAAKGEFVLLLHEDAEPLAGMTERLLVTLKAEPKAAAVGPWIDELRGAQGINAGWLRFGRDDLLISPEQLPEGLADAPYAVNQVSTAISLWRRSAWEAIGGFDERTYPALGVEPDSFTGLWARGYVVLVEPAARGRHGSGALDSAPGLLRGPRVRHYLLKQYFDVWDAKWAARADWFVGRDEDGWDGEPFSKAAVDAAIERAQQLRVSPPTIADPPRSEQPLSNPTGALPPPVEVDAAMAERLRAAERKAIDGYTDWLIDRDIEMTDRYEDVHAAYLDLGARVEDLEARSSTLEHVLGTRWWRLRARARRLLGR
jgi:GT2 family glycosyltransferase